jgi:hypothetical protein
MNRKDRQKTGIEKWVDIRGHEESESEANTESRRYI